MTRNQRFYKIASKWQQLGTRVHFSSRFWILFLMLLISRPASYCRGAFLARSRVDLKGAVNACHKLLSRGDCSKGPHRLIGGWDVSRVTDMNQIFSNSKSFNADISNWDVSNARDMSGMFHLAKSFNSDLSKWDVSSVTKMPGMFRVARSFNGDISRWDVSRVNNMNSMFQGAILFTRKLCGAAWVHSEASQSKMFEGSSGSISTRGCTTTKKECSILVLEGDSTREYTLKNFISGRDRRRFVVFPGSFNPPHDGHMGLVESALKIITAKSHPPQHITMVFELSLVNADKKPIGTAEFQLRAAAILAMAKTALPDVVNQPDMYTLCVAGSNAPLFTDKIRLFPGCSFLIGADTAMRILDPKYYDNSIAKMRTAVEAIINDGHEFFVAGRLVAGTLVTLGKIPVFESLPSSVQSGFVPIPDFRRDISSTQLRAQQALSTSTGDTAAVTSEPFSPRSREELKSAVDTYTKGSPKEDCSE